MNGNEATLLWADEYSRMAETYDRQVVPRFEPIAQVVANLAAPRSGELFLDVGTGTGLLARILAPLVAPQSVVAIDLADNAISVGSFRAGDAGIRNIRFEMMDSRNIVYRSRLFDAVVSNFGVPTFGHDRTFTEAHRVLKSGGRFVFSEWDSELPQGSRILYALVRKHRNEDPSRTLSTLREATRLSDESDEGKVMGSPAAVEAALHASGFERIDILSKEFGTRFPTTREFLAFESAWGPIDREISEMPSSARRSFEEELESELGSRMTPEGFEESWKVHFYVARRE